MNLALNNSLIDSTYETQKSQNFSDIFNNSNITEKTTPPINPVININTIIPAFIIASIVVPIQIIIALISGLRQLNDPREEKQIKKSIKIIFLIYIFYIINFIVLLIFPTTFSNNHFYFIPVIGLLLIILSLVLYSRSTIELYTRK